MKQKPKETKKGRTIKQQNKKQINKDRKHEAKQTERKYYETKRNNRACYANNVEATFQRFYTV